MILKVFVLIFFFHNLIISVQSEHTLYGFVLESNSSVTLSVINQQNGQATEFSNSYYPIVGRQHSWASTYNPQTGDIWFVNRSSVACLFNVRSKTYTNMVFPHIDQIHSFDYDDYKNIVYVLGTNETSTRIFAVSSGKIETVWQVDQVLASLKIFKIDGTNDIVLMEIIGSEHNLVNIDMKKKTVMELTPNCSYSQWKPRLITTGWNNMLHRVIGIESAVVSQGYSQPRTVQINPYTGDCRLHDSELVEPSFQDLKITFLESPPTFYGFGNIANKPYPSLMKAYADGNVDYGPPTPIAKQLYGLQIVP